MAEERRPVNCLATFKKIDCELFDRFSCIIKLQRTTAYCLRFIKRLKLLRIQNWRDPVKTSASFTTLKELRGQKPHPLKPSELEAANLKLIYLVQQQEFAAEIHSLSKKEPLDRNSKLLQLNPFLDGTEILRVGGRLHHAKIPEAQKFPILLPNKHVFTRLLIQQAHKENYHAGPQATLSFLQQKYWIIRGKDVVSSIIKKCIKCTKLRATTLQQIMADLPFFRVNKCHTFQWCGLDYAGPFLTRPNLTRSKVTIKAYLAIFVCCATRAIHLEVVSSLSTDDFLACLRRFIARRGKPTDMYSDNGTNFVGADRVLKELYHLFKSNTHQEKITNAMTNEGINWHFNPPAAPHYGGLWEAGVKSTKYHLRRIMGNTRLTFEELSTVVAQIEAILNSRPLTPESVDPSDLRALTPGHFLIGQPLTSFPEPDLTNLSKNRLARWQSIQQMVQYFWKRWSSEYITRLQQRPKWWKSSESIKPGSLVIIKEDNLPPLQWRLGRVTEIHPGADGHVRTVTVQTSQGIYKRPIVKLCLLPIETIQPADPKKGITAEADTSGRPECLDSTE